jgi:hypothetical protein
LQVVSILPDLPVASKAGALDDRFVIFRATVPYLNPSEVCMPVAE